MKRISCNYSSLERFFEENQKQSKTNSPQLHILKTRIPLGNEENITQLIFTQRHKFFHEDWLSEWKGYQKQEVIQAFQSLSKLSTGDSPVLRQKPVKAVKHELNATASIYSIEKTFGRFVAQEIKFHPTERSDLHQSYSFTQMCR